MNEATVPVPNRPTAHFGNGTLASHVYDVCLYCREFYFAQKHKNTKTQKHKNTKTFCVFVFLCFCAKCHEKPIQQLNIFWGKILNFPTKKVYMRRNSVWNLHKNTKTQKSMTLWGQSNRRAAGRRSGPSHGDFWGGDNSDAEVQNYREIAPSTAQSLKAGRAKVAALSTIIGYRGGGCLLLQCHHDHGWRLWLLFRGCVPPRYHTCLLVPVL